MARSEVEEILLLLIFLTLIVLSTAVIIKMSGDFLGKLGVVADKVTRLAEEIV